MKVFSTHIPFLDRRVHPEGLLIAMDKKLLNTFCKEDEMEYNTIKYDQIGTTIFRPMQVCLIKFANCTSSPNAYPSTSTFFMLIFIAFLL